MKVVPPSSNDATENPCPKCAKAVFMAEARVAGKYRWHTNCFTCRK